MSDRSIPARDYYTPELLAKLGAWSAKAFRGTRPEAIALALREAGIGIVDLDRTRHLIDERVYESALLRARAAEERAAGTETTEAAHG
jgi:hypothetical protein